MVASEWHPLGQGMSSNIRIATDMPIALDSPDHLHPLGTMQDNNANPNFNNKLYNLVPREELSVMDLGCAGGGFVKSLLDDGVMAIGIEGSDYSLVRRRAEWETIPDSLFTADISYPFLVYGSLGIIQFSVITAWEFLEHISSDRLEVVSNNVRIHLEQGGLFIASINSGVSRNYDGTELHQTIQPEEWWNKRLDELGWVRIPDLESHFGNDVVRDGAGSFFVVLKEK